MRPTVSAWILLAGLFLVPTLGQANKASLFIHPTLVMFAADTRQSAVVTIVNRGDATGVFKINWVDLAMTAQGGLESWEGVAPWSIQPYVRYSPRRVTLKPGENQLIKIALRRKQNVAEGEYYSHLKVVSLNDNVDGPVANAASDGRQTIAIKAHTAFAIPVVWRNSTAEPSAQIESVEIDPESNQLVVDVRRLGKLSTRGYVHVVQAGTQNPMADPVPLVIYPTLERKKVSIALNGRVSKAGTEFAVIYSTELVLTRKQTPLASYQITL